LSDYPTIKLPKAGQNCSFEVMQQVIDSGAYLFGVASDPGVEGRRSLIVHVFLSANDPLKFAGSAASLADDRSAR